MKIPLLLALVLLPLSAAAQGGNGGWLAASEEHRGWQPTAADKWFVSLDLLGTGTFDHGPRNDSDGNLAGFRANGFSADGDWHTAGGGGVRLGYLHRLNEAFDLGGSAGFMGGPSFDNTFAASKGGNSVAWTDQGTETYLRLMAETQWHHPLNDRWSFHVQGAAGLSVGWQTDTFRCSATGLACPRPLGDTTSFSPGVSWELGPAVSYKHWLLWMGITGFPRAGGSQQVAVPAWRAFQLSLKYAL